MKDKVYRDYKKSGCKSYVDFINKESSNIKMTSESLRSSSSAREISERSFDFSELRTDFRRFLFMFSRKPESTLKVFLKVSQRWNLYQNRFRFSRYCDTIFAVRVVLPMPAIPWITSILCESEFNHSSSFPSSFFRPTKYFCWGILSRYSSYSSFFVLSSI